MVIYDGTMIIYDDNVVVICNGGAYTVLGCNGCKVNVKGRGEG